MSLAELLGYLGMLVGGATPLLEALVVVPVGIVAGLAPVPAAALAVVGNIATVALAALWGERLNRWWWRRRRRAGAEAGAVEAHRAGPSQAEPDAPPGPNQGEPDAADSGGATPAHRRRGRAARVWRRYGLPGLAVLAPVVTGTQLAALVAVTAGAPRDATVWWISAGTLAWAAVAAVATSAGVGLFTG